MARIHITLVGGQPAPVYNCIEWQKRNPDSDAMIRIHLQSKSKVHDATLKSPHAIELAFNSGWFEYKVARILSGWDRVRSVFLNCHFPFEKQKDKNEVDIIADIGNKVLIVECKTQITNTTDIDKFQSVVRGYGGTGSKALFVTDAKMKEMARQKCSHYGIMNFSLSEAHPELDANKALFLLLETELFNINVK